MCYEQRWKPVLIMTVLSVIVSLCGVVLLTESLVFNFMPTLLTADLGPGLTPQM